ncbi:SsrA-binding protein SmpB [Simiduia sp. 21SJ11W-1]|uniref:SsrA-binding protein SmpB n=1 Tax=Simiduia sp. 21SJ11W-1 TaxID=2909669 RepID=UPI00209F1E68|nr:SsrA-binding protein SmpB [Simiduia sp. 21SJ11W-1]UTA47045.1 SsrA-binding protein SmpB [Simiduia sp. 21SJ11W-1]
MAKPKKKPADNTIAQNKKARFDYALGEKFEAGLELQGWEVKSLRAGKIQLVDSFVQFHRGEAWLMGALVSPMQSVSTHYVAEPNRKRKLLLHRRELARLQQGVEQKGYTVVCTALYWKNHLVKAAIALAKGKAEHDKRNTEKERDWNREKQRVVRDHNR